MRNFWMVLVFIGLYCPVGQVCAQELTVKSLRYSTKKIEARLVLDTASTPVQDIVLLQDPTRLVIDLKKARLATELEQPSANDPFFASFHSEVDKDNNLSVIVGLKKNVAFNSFILKPNHMYGHRLVIDVFDTGPMTPVSNAKPMPIATKTRPHMVKPPELGLPAPRPKIAPAPASAKESLFDELKRGFYSRLYILGFGIAQNPKETNLNKDNGLGLTRYQAVLNPRLDLNMDFRQLELGVKPRYLVNWQRWEDGKFNGNEETDQQLYVNEWFTRFRLADEFLVSYGRENMQWGPSVILSSSNPFNRENGRNNTQVEVPGLGYARAVWIPNSEWSASFIANTDEGRLNSAQGFGLNQSGFLNQAGQTKTRGFEPSYALKIDYTGEGKYASVIPSYREHEGYRVGYFGGWNVSDALLLYGEGSFSEHDDFQVQAGGAYTLEAGPTLNVEYFHDNDGCLRDRIEQCFLQGETKPGDILFRQDYLMAQYTDTKVWNDLNLNFRVVHNLNDSSNRFIGMFEYEVDDHTALYLNANGFTGSSSSEYGSLLRYSIFAGAGYTF